MADHDTNVRPYASIERRSKTKPPAREVTLLLNELRGVPHDTPSLLESLALRDIGWRLVVVYCRISNDRHRRDGHGVQDQAKHCTRIAAQHRMIVVHRYVDNDRSASKLGVKRPEFDAMLEALKLGTTTAGFPIDGVVCVSDDRLYRDVHTYQQFLKCFTEHPARVYADGVGSYDLYSEEAARRGLLGAVAARAESKKQAHRATLSHRARAERGEPVAVRRPFGWNADLVTLHPGESEVVRRGVQSFLEGKTLTAVTQDFVASGFTSTLGNPWQRQTVKQILRNPRICGYRKLNGTLILGTDGKPVVGQWQPIVSPAEWQLAAESLERKRHPGGWQRNGAASGEGTTYLLTGLARCGRPLTGGQQCGASLHGCPTSDSYLYRCRTALDGGCGRISRQGPAVDDLIARYALAALDRQVMLDVRSAIPWPDAQRLETATYHKAALQEQWYAAEISDSEYFSQLRQSETEIKRLVNEQQAWFIRNRPGAHRHTDAQARWDGLSVIEKRGILFAVLESVIILPGTKGSHRFEPSTVIPVWRTQPTTSVV
ncbi:DNA invertase Pin-like site-specific DNA recombinase [Streptomyces canus]|uniref:DNA invertase Pin-like site-specific DNA recombinase n=1 Tax=Streptomyces canus TaxID=58343 RepID=A0AAW8FHB1_9ACTN|nr:recombinase family protein [Streptomyces canus]MDQ0908540.1 DNA invertase Pin-like site-specific DNA recombinase [Streptomyces canus]